MDDDKEMGGGKHYLALQSTQRRRCGCCMAKC